MEGSLSLHQSRNYGQSPPSFHRRTDTAGMQNTTRGWWRKGRIHLSQHPTNRSEVVRQGTSTVDREYNKNMCFERRHTTNRGTTPPSWSTPEWGAARGPSTGHGTHTTNLVGPVLDLPRDVSHGLVVSIGPRPQRRVEKGRCRTCLEHACVGRWDTFCEALDVCR